LYTRKLKCIKEKINIRKRNSFMKRFGIKLGLKSLKMSRKQSIYGKTVGYESVNSIFFPLSIGK
jgi:hypothetical protein